MSEGTSLMVQKMQALVAASQKRLEQTTKQHQERQEEYEKERDALAQKEARIVFAVDATMSRQTFWTEAKTLQEEMFFQIQRCGSRVSTQLASYSGDTYNRDIDVSPWYSEPGKLCDRMDEVRCVAGGTQIAKVFEHAVRECTAHKVDALILVVDSCEEAEHDLLPLAYEVGKRNIQFFLFDDKQRTTCRQGETERVFKSIVDAAQGYYAPFDDTSPDVIRDYLRTVTAAATRNKRAMVRAGDAIRTPEGMALYQKSLKRLGFDG